MAEIIETFDDFMQAYEDFKATNDARNRALGLPETPPIFTTDLKIICAARCAGFGDPPCWQLPGLTSDCDGKVIEPCKECMEEGNADRND